MSKIIAEGNNGGDRLEIELLPDGRLRLIVDHCCQHELDCVVPVEVITTALSNSAAEVNYDLKEWAVGDWPREYVATLVPQVIDLNTVSGAVDWINLQRQGDDT